MTSGGRSHPAPPLIHVACCCLANPMEESIPPNLLLEAAKRSLERLEFPVAVQPPHDNDIEGHAVPPFATSDPTLAYHSRSCQSFI
jgi:hypothetical protein